MMLQHKSAQKRTIHNGFSDPVSLGSRQTDLKAPVERLLRDVAFVLHATEVVRRAMEAEQALFTAAS
jgi:hypothetical protein